MVLFILALPICDSDDDFMMRSVERRLQGVKESGRERPSFKLRHFEEEETVAGAISGRARVGLYLISMFSVLLKFSL